MSELFHHSQLYRIRGSRVTPDLIQFRSLPYARVPRRFGRATFLDHLPQATTNETACYDATEYGPCSIQPHDSIATDLRWNQLPAYPHRDQDQSEDCLSISLTCPATILDDSSAGLPVAVFVHGGALMIGSGTMQCICHVYWY